MELIEFLQQTQAEVRAEIGERLGEAGEAYPYPESVFAEKVMDHMSEFGMTFEPQVCHYEARVRNAKLRLSGYAVSEEAVVCPPFTICMPLSHSIPAPPSAVFPRCASSATTTIPLL